MVGLLVLSMHIDRKPEAVVVKLPAGPAQPRLPATEAGLDPAALESAVAYAGARRSTALVVSRGGHIVFEKYWNGTNFDTPVAPGFDPALVALAVSSALDDRLIGSLDQSVSSFVPDAGPDIAAIPLREVLARDHAELSLRQSTDLVALILERVARQPYEKFMAERLWKPIGGGDLEFRRQDGKSRPRGVDTTCCVRARLGDWMRVGELLANQGNFEGGQVALPHYVKLMLSPAHKDSPHGYFTRVDGSFATHDVAWLDGPGNQRMWIVPSLQLAILRLGEAPEKSAGWDEAMIPDSIIRGTSGWQPRTGTDAIDPNRYAPH
jgi:hypothetical protein